MAVSLLHLIDADGLDARELAVSAPPFHLLQAGKIAVLWLGHDC